MNVLDIEAKYLRSEKIHEAWPKSLSVGNFTKSFVLHVSILYYFRFTSSLSEILFNFNQ